MTQPFSDTQTKRAENISLNCLSVNHLQAFLGGRMRCQCQITVRSLKTSERIPPVKASGSRGCTVVI